MHLIQITPVAHEHFIKLLAQEPPGTSLRIFATNPGTPKADIGICFCLPGEEVITDHKIEFENYVLYIDANSKDALTGANIDYEFDTSGGELSIKAPNLKGEAPNDNSPLFDRIAYVIDTEINPALAAHRGMITLIEVTKFNVVRLKFGGGCQGCGMANVTLKSGIEANLCEKFPMITAIEDVTEHAAGENPYY